MVPFDWKYFVALLTSLNVRTTSGVIPKFIRFLLCASGRRCLRSSLLRLVQVYAQVPSRALLGLLAIEVCETLPLDFIMTSTAKKTLLLVFITILVSVHHAFSAEMWRWDGHLLVLLLFYFEFFDCRILGNCNINTPKRSWCFCMDLSKRYSTKEGDGTLFSTQNLVCERSFFVLTVKVDMKLIKLSLQRSAIWNFAKTSTFPVKPVDIKGFIFHKVFLARPVAYGSTPS